MGRRRRTTSPSSTPLDAFAELVDDAGALVPQGQRQPVVYCSSGKSMTNQSEWHSPAAVTFSLI